MNSLIYHQKRMEILRSGKIDPMFTHRRPRAYDLLIPDDHLAIRLLKLDFPDFTLEELKRIFVSCLAKDHRYKAARYLRGLNLN